MTNIVLYCTALRAMGILIVVIEGFGKYSPNKLKIVKRHYFPSLLLKVLY